MASCYERQIGFIQADSELQLGKLKGGRCSEQAEKLASNFDALQDGNASLQAFQGSWSGFELSVQSELLKNRAIGMLAHECGA
jgi:hypothetical protein